WAAGNQGRGKGDNPSTGGLLTRLNIGDGVTNFGDDPRALAANAAGTEVYAVMLESGNRSPTLFEDLVSSGGGPPPPNPPRSGSLGAAPAVGLIVQFNRNNWGDETNDIWNSFIDYNLPDQDVFVIDADAGTPSVIRRLVHVGTTLFDVAVQPGTGDLWVPNTDARNLVRFEPKLRGHLVETRITFVDPTTGVVPPFIDLNSHINFNLTPGPPSEVAASLAHPVTGIFNGSGSAHYRARLRSPKGGGRQTHN